MIAKKMISYIEGGSAIRAMFEDGKKMAARFGAGNVFDFSLGNPNVNPPEAVKTAIREILDEEEPTFVHGYMSNVGYEDVRDAVAGSLNRKFGTDFTRENIVMTVGAAGGINVMLKSLVDPGDEVVVFAPFFGEYTRYIANVDGRLVVVPPNPPTFQPNVTEFEKLLSPKTKIVLMNSPNNPTGVVYSEETIKTMADILRRKQAEFGTDIYLIADEPYREVAYNDVHVPYVTKYYENTIVGYSYSKSLSLPGERIGYLVIPGCVADFENILLAVDSATRTLGFVNAPSLMQRVVARCLDEQTDVAAYKKNRDAFYNGLTERGYECVEPEGAFYLFVKSPIADDVAFCAKAKDYQLILVPGSAFACPGYLRMAYCVAYDTIVGALPHFKELIEDIKAGK